MDSSFFRGLTDSEATEFVQWARDNFVPGMEINPCWHPVIQEELKRLQEVSEAKQEEVETPLGEALDQDYDYDAGYNEYEDDSFNAQYDDDPSPYDGTYSED
jgi:hypothetical protein